MARIKNLPIRREPSWSAAEDEKTNGAGVAVSETEKKMEKKPEVKKKKEAGLITLIIDVAGIYASFLTWAYLQEKVTTTVYHNNNNNNNMSSSAVPSTEKFKFSVFLLTIQSLFAGLGGLLFTYLSTPKGSRIPPIIPNKSILLPLLLVAFTNALAAPFGYAALGHIDYITYILAKSCKLLPVMFLHITLFRKKYPLYKYLVVAAVTCGVAIFTLHSGSKKKAYSSHSGQTAWGMLLLGINLLFDGLTNSTQDFIFATYQPYSGPQMMAANNLMSFMLTGSYLLVSPWLVNTAVGEWFGMGPAAMGGHAGGELKAALEFLNRHPEVWRDVIGFAAFGMVGQVFIFHTLSTFSSVLLVTVTVTRKMFTMILSVVAFGHRLSQMQWLGVGLVFGAIGVEAQIQRREKLAKEAAKKAAAEGKAQ
ncbi:UAA transporter [Podospora fimiseda]|uniref:UDP-galactose transporter homolog 1 n=1 Tax=Podospora fimiseda TaxID=252190 RepID=A0AAN6YN25_9PEZI|nr:UAA transporter [Podospora fimiseda]